MEHAGPVVKTKDGASLIDCTSCGFIHIDPLPSREETEHKYTEEYYTDDKPLYIDHHLEDESWWNFCYRQKIAQLEEFGAKAPSSLLDIGSGPGFFLKYAMKQGWKIAGIEPSPQAADYAEGEGLFTIRKHYDQVEQEDFPRFPFQVIHLENVLEHLRDPFHLMKRAGKWLADGGLLSVIVPNDFNPFQLAANEKVKRSDWWVVPDHHINYFTAESLKGFLERSGFEIVFSRAQFPMELFLLMGKNYIDNPSAGRDCQRERMRFELALSEAGQQPLLDQLYQAFARLGIGRQIEIIAKKK